MAKKQKAKIVNADFATEMPIPIENEFMLILAPPPVKPEGKIPQVLVGPEAVDGI